MIWANEAENREIVVEENVEEKTEDFWTEFERKVTVQKNLQINAKKNMKWCIKSISQKNAVFILVSRVYR